MRDDATRKKKKFMEDSTTRASQVGGSQWARELPRVTRILVPSCECAAL